MRANTIVCERINQIVPLEKNEDAYSNSEVCADNVTTGVAKLTLMTRYLPAHDTVLHSKSFLIPVL